MKTIKITETKKKTSKIIAEMKKLFDVYCWYDMKQLDKDFPPPKKITTRYFKGTVEADEELKDKSANDLEKEGIEGITLRERLLMELQYFKETGNHLDVDNVTLCSGSRYSGGNVPYVGWNTGHRRVFVSWCRPSGSGSDLRARAVVSKPSISKLVPSAIIDINQAIERVKQDGYYQCLYTLRFLCEIYATPFMKLGNWATDKLNKYYYKNVK